MTCPFGYILHLQTASIEWAAASFASGFGVNNESLMRAFHMFHSHHSHTALLPALPERTSAPSHSQISESKLPPGAGGARRKRRASQSRSLSGTSSTFKLHLHTFKPDPSRGRSALILFTRTLWTLLGGSYAGATCCNGRDSDRLYPPSYPSAPVSIRYAACARVTARSKQACAVVCP
ncbi:hypothetical protein MSAN_00135600 [Mycena sanguinolenta]|uniref:Uncharacterized protein n=1 Tax=Mycena sanguinolenta TaxID=230812 RepID=A0A8H6ZGZ5_9AGAR|nr:hypothetical protein MSAN_00135600 [Mycena sanguinolenta]